MAFKQSALIVFAAGCLSAQSYWPLQVGSRWELRSGGTTMAYEVTGKTGDVYQVRWENPWVKATFGFRAHSDSVELATLDMGQGVMQMPAGTIYFDFTKRQGESWSNALGRIAVLQRGADIDTPVGKFSNIIALRATDTKNTHTFWAFAPGIGPVRFGEGRGAFLLTSYKPGAGGGRDSAVSDARKPAERDNRGWRRDDRQSTTRRGPGRAGPERGLIAIDANPAPNEGYGADAKLRRARMAREAGAGFLYYAPKWNEIEPSAGRYKFDDLEHNIRVAREHNWPVSLNVRVIDTNNLAAPAPYSRMKFNDPKMAEGLRNLLAAIAERTEGRVRWIQIGNEVNEYLKSHQGDIPAYRQLLDSVLPDVRSRFPNAAFSVNFTFFAAPEIERYRELTSLCDFSSFTYYPLNADMTFRPPNVVPGDFQLMLQASGGKPLFLQEVGYASSQKLHSSEATQAEFIRQIFAAVRANRNSIIGAHFVWMSDLPDSVVDDLTKYYRMKGAGNFREYLSTLGYFDKQGRPKDAWRVFEEEGRRSR